MTKAGSTSLGEVRLAILAFGLRHFAFCHLAIWPIWQISKSQGRSARKVQNQAAHFFGLDTWQWHPWCVRGMIAAKQLFPSYCLSDDATGCLVCWLLLGVSEGMAGAWADNVPLLSRATHCLYPLALTRKNVPHADPLILDIRRSLCFSPYYLGVGQAPVCNQRPTGSSSQA